MSITRTLYRGAAFSIIALFLLNVACGEPQTGYTETEYPIVLAHGALGMESYGPLEYWYGIVSALEDGGADVYVTQVSPINSSYVRGDQLLGQVQNILAITGKAKVNLIGHSQGGLDARYVAGVRPDLVASVTTIGSPHKGADLAEFIVGGIEEDGTVLSVLVDFFGSLLGDVLSLLSGQDDPIDARAALIHLSPSGIAQFNIDFPGGLPAGCHPGAPVANGVHYFSWTGAVTGSNVLDPTDPLMELAGLFYLLEPNDGLVSVCSAQLGDVIRDNYLMNHLDEVNQILGLISILETNTKTVFRNHANRLKNLGL